MFDNHDSPLTQKLSRNLRVYVYGLNKNQTPHLILIHETSRQQIDRSYDLVQFLDTLKLKLQKKTVSIRAHYIFFLPYVKQFCM